MSFSLALRDAPASPLPLRYARTLLTATTTLPSSGAWGSHRLLLRFRPGESELKRRPRQREGRLPWTRPNHVGRAAGLVLANPNPRIAEDEMLFAAPQWFALTAQAGSVNIRHRWLLAHIQSPRPKFTEEIIRLNCEKTL